MHSARQLGGFHRSRILVPHRYSSDVHLLAAAKHFRLEGRNAIGKAISAGNTRAAEQADTSRIPVEMKLLPPIDALLDKI